MKPLIDVLDEMNMKEDTTNKMVVSKLQILSGLIFSVKDNEDLYWGRINTGNENPDRLPDLQFVDTILEDLIESPHHRITRLEIEKCNKLYRKYNK